MKELTATATALVRATPEQCVALFAAVDRYPSWHPQVIPHAEALQRDASGVPTQVRATVNLTAGPLSRQFELVMAVAVKPAREVTLSRVADGGEKERERFDVRWRVQRDGETRIELLLAARLDVPRLVPVGSIGDSVAQHFVEAAKRALEDSSPNTSASSS
jgi:ribosome-associated toxin RatA of RatAB toxin-antitoxin module